MGALDLETTLAAAGAEPWIIRRLSDRARNRERSLDPFLDSVGDPATLANTRTTWRSHFVKCDPHGRPRVSALVDMLTDEIVDYCIPRSRINEALAASDAADTTSKILQLQREAKRLFGNVTTSGEGGELLLYALLEIALGIPQILCKMPLKTNPNVHYHGVDGIHAKALPNGNLAVYWGEAKLYAKASQSIDSAMRSLAPFLLDRGGGSTERDIVLLRDHLDSGDSELDAALVRYFTEGTFEASCVEVRGACLVGFSVADYASPFTQEKALRAEVASAVARWAKRLESAIANEKLASFEIEVFFVPLPSVQDFRDELRSSLGLGK